MYQKFDDNNLVCECEGAGNVGNQMCRVKEDQKRYDEVFGGSLYILATPDV